MRTSRGSSAGSTSSGSSGVTNSYNVALDLNWEIDLWGGIRRGIEASGATAQAIATYDETVPNYRGAALTDFHIGIASWRDMV